MAKVEKADRFYWNVSNCLRNCESAATARGKRRLAVVDRRSVPVAVIRGRICTVMGCQGGWQISQRAGSLVGSSRLPIE